MTEFSSTLAPVVLFVYARPWHAQRTVEALAANEGASETDLIIFSDAARNEKDAPSVRDVREWLPSITGFRSVTIHEQQKNLGLADSIINGVSSVISRYGRVIVVEDDLITSPYFLRYMNDALELYAHDDKVMHIAGYMFPMDTNGLPETVFLRQSSCWGWATWERAWRHFTRDSTSIINRFSEEDIYRFNLDGTMDYWSQLMANHTGTLRTWAVFWYASVFMRGGLCLHPRECLVHNCGFDGSGENCGIMKRAEEILAPASVSVYRQELQESTAAMERLKAFLHNQFSNIDRLKVNKQIKNRLVYTMNTFIQKIKEKIKNKIINQSLADNKTEMDEKTETEIFFQNGAKPWTQGYEEYKWNSIEEEIYNNDFYKQIGSHHYGYRIDERIVEIPWVINRLPEGKCTMLDAGSALNYKCIVNHPKIAEKKLFISTLAPEGHAFFDKGISYIYEDIRNSCFRNGFFDCIACVSTIEHVGMDNTFLYTSDLAKKENNEDVALEFIKVLHDKLKDGGSLFLTLPYGLYKNHGWFRVFNKDMMNELIAAFNPQKYTQEIFEYKDDRWCISDEEQAKYATCFDIHVQKEYEHDFLAFSRAIACLELVK